LPGFVLGWFFFFHLSQLRRRMRGIPQRALRLCIIPLIV
jgi:hypothetical protein